MVPQDIILEIFYFNTTHSLLYCLDKKYRSLAISYLLNQQNTNSLLMLTELPLIQHDYYDKADILLSVLKRNINKYQYSRAINIIVDIYPKLLYYEDMDESFTLKSKQLLNTISIDKVAQTIEIHKRYELLAILLRFRDVNVNNLFNKRDNINAEANRVVQLICKEERDKATTYLSNNNIIATSVDDTLDNIFNYKMEEIVI